MPEARAAAAAPGVPDSVRTAHCSWDAPGHNPFMGDLVAAVDRYPDIPADVRARLKRRMAARDYDDIAVITRDSLEGREHYDPTIRDMHFGANRVCTSVSRDKWSATHRERGLVYCESGQCLIVPTVCRNLSRITRRDAPAPLAALPPAMPSVPPAGELLFDAPGAGLPVAADSPVAPTGVAAGPDTFGGAPAGAGGPMAGAAAGAAAGGGGEAFSALPFAPVVAGLVDGGRRQFGAGDINGAESGGAVAPVLAAVPEPGTWALMALGLLVLASTARTSRHRPDGL